MSGSVEFYFWPGDQWSQPEMAVGWNGSDSFKVVPVVHLIRQSPMPRKFLENPKNGWVKLMTAPDSD